MWATRPDRVSLVSLLWFGGPVSDTSSHVESRMLHVKQNKAAHLTGEALAESENGSGVRVPAQL